MKGIESEVSEVNKRIRGSRWAISQGQCLRGREKCFGDRTQQIKGRGKAWVCHFHPQGNKDIAGHTPVERELNVTVYENDKF